VLGSEQVDNDAWKAVNREMEKAQDALKTAQFALQGATASNNKKLIKERTADVDQASKTVTDLSAKLDNIPPKVSRDIVKPYNYTKLTTDLNGDIKLQFKITNSFNQETIKTDPIERPAHRQDIQIVGAEGTDQQGIKNVGVPSNSDEFTIELENSVRNELVAKVKEKVAELPKMLFDLAKHRENEDDLDGAGELYLRYLEITPDNKSQERSHALDFLKENFDLRPQVLAAQ
jgi:hypothetical protein